MSNPLSDRNLLLGVLALQFGLVTRDQLVDAISAWGSDKAQPLDEIFVRQKAITPDHRQRLAELVALHVQLHGGDVEKSLAALSSVAAVRSDLRCVDDSDLEASLLLLKPEAPAKEPAPDATLSVGVPTSDGARFRILRPHAKGGLGEVSVAFDAELNREVALKEIQRQHADHSDSRSRFLLEAQITGGLEHPGIVPVYGMGTYADGRPYYAMRFIRGDSLKDGIRKLFAQYAKPSTNDDGDEATNKLVKLPARAYESFEFRKLLQRFIDVCNAIAYAHTRGVLHRDLKPGNIMLGKYGETLVVDWGLAKATGKLDDSVETSQAPITPSTDSGSAETVMGSAFGTPAYMSPEQAAGRVDRFTPATDIYCLGATLYHLLTGTPPHSQRNDGQLLHRIQAGEFPEPRDLNNSIPPALAAICQKALAVEPRDRYSTALALATDVEHWLADDPIAAHRDSVATQLRRWSRRHRVLVTAAIVLLATVSIALGAGLFFVRAEQRRTVVAKEQAEAAAAAANSAKSVALSAQASAETERRLAQTEKQRADENAMQARAESTRADAAAVEALRQKDAAERFLYFNGIALAKSRFDSGLFDEAQEALEACSWHLRGWEHAYLKELCRTANPTIIKRPGDLWSLAVSPDERLVAITEKRKTIIIDMSSKEIIRFLNGHEDDVLDAQFSPDGTRLLTAGALNFKVWDVATGMLIYTSPRHLNNVACATWSPGGEWIASSHGFAKRISIWNATTGEKVRDLDGHLDYVSALEFSPDGAYLVSGSQDRTARIWDPATGAELHRLIHRGPVFEVAFAPNSGVFVTAGVQPALRLWDVVSGEELRDIDVRGAAAMTVDFSADGSQVVAGCSDNVVRVWDADSCKERAATTTTDEVAWDVIFLADRRVLGRTSGSRIKLWDLLKTNKRKATEVLAHQGKVVSLAYVPSSGKIASGGSDGTIRIWHPDLNLDRNFGIHPAGLNCCAVSPGGELLASGGRDGKLRIWNMPEGKVIHTLDAHQGPGLQRGMQGMMSVAFDRDGNRILTGGFGPYIEKVPRGELKIWDATTGENIKSQTANITAVLCARFSTDETAIASVGCDYATRLWNADTGAPVPIGLNASSWGNCVDFSSDGHLIATATASGQIKIFDLKQGRIRHTLFGHTGEVLCLQFTPDGRRIVSGGIDQSIRVWDTETGMMVFTIRKGRSPVTSLVFDVAHQNLLTGAADGRIYSWHAPADLHFETRAHELTANAVALGPDRKVIATCGNDEYVKLFDSKSGRDLGAWPGHFMHSTLVGFLEDGESIVTFGRVRNEIKVWDLNSKGGSWWELPLGKRQLTFSLVCPGSPSIVLATIEGNLEILDCRSKELRPAWKAHAAAIKTVGFSDDGKTIVSASADNAVCCWEYPAGRKIGELSGLESPLLSVDLDAEGELLVAGDAAGRIHVWKLPSMERVQQIEAHVGWINAIQISRNGTLLISGGEDGAVRVWDAKSGQRISTLGHHGGGVTSLALYPDASRALSVGDDGRLKSWIIPAARLSPSALPPGNGPDN